MWVARVVAHHRLSVPYATDAARETLTHLAEHAHELPVAERRGSENVTRAQRVELPAHRPISVAL